MQISFRTALQEFTILIIDDDPMICETLKNLLGRLCHRVLIASNGKEGLEAFYAHAPDIILSDVDMPQLDGLKLAQAIRNSHAPKTPIILFTGRSDTEQLRQALSLGLVDYLQKPLEFETLYNALLRALQRLQETNLHFVKITETLHYHPTSKRLRCGEEWISLVKKEILLLELLLKHRNRLVLRHHIEDAVWGDEVMSDGALKTLLNKLRKKIGKEQLITIAKSGYLLKGFSTVC